MTNRTSPLTSLALAVAAVVLVTAVGGPAALTLSASGQQTAQALPPPPPPPPPGAGRPGPDARLDRLGLTATQWDEVEAILEQARADAAPYHDEMRAAHEAMRKAAQADVFDEAAVRTIAASQVDATIEVAVIDTRAQSAIYRLLTTEQRARLAKLTREAPPPRRR